MFPRVPEPQADASDHSQCSVDTLPLSATEYQPRRVARVLRNRSAASTLLPVLLVMLGCATADAAASARMSAEAAHTGRVSVSDGGGGLAAASRAPAISNDGSVVAFQ